MTFHDTIAALERRRSRMARELEDEGVRFSSRDDPLPGGFDQRAEFEELMLDEVLYARFSPTHERIRSPYASVVVSSLEWLKEPLLTAYKLGLILTADPIPTSGSLDECRMLSDGEKTLLVRLPEGPGGLLRIADGDELTVVRLVEELNIGVAQRRQAGVLKVFCEDRVYIFDQDDWAVKRFASARAFETTQFLGLSSETYHDVVRQLLEFSFHTLSDRHVGASLVWFARKAPVGEHPGMSGGFDLPAKLSLARTLDHEPVAALLTRTDGAAILGPDGQVLKAGVHLRSTDDAAELVRAEGGTRHTSAKRFSFDEPESVVIVVSQDGPVTVYSDGANLLQMRAVGAYAASLEDLAPDKAEDIYSHVYSTTCPRCHHKLRIEITVVVGWKDHEVVNCPICAHPNVAEHSAAFSIEASPLKVWDDAREYLP